MEEHTKEIRDYIIVLRKNKWIILAIMTAILVITIMLAALLPPTYRSTATILIEQQDIPSDLVRSTVTSYAAERIQTIQARVMSRTNLLEIIKKFELYRDEIKVKTTEEIVGEMRADTKLDVISAEVVDPRTGRQSKATIAFSLSYEGKGRASVQRVANELTSLYLNENLRSRTQKAEETSLFLKEESVRLGDHISELEQRLAEFKQNNSDIMPDLQQLNLQVLQRTEAEIEQIISQMQSLQERKFYLEGQLALLDPTESSVPSASYVLKVREAEYASAKSRYSDDHPDVLRLKREIEILEDEVSATPGSRAMSSELRALKPELALLNDKYTDSHPDVMKMQTRIASLEAGIVAEKKANGGYTEKPSNPAYITLKAQLEGVLSDVRALSDQKKAAKKKLLDLESRLIKSPQVEREYLVLTRDYENALVRYRETKTKEMQANVAQQLEEERKGERFTLIDPAALPEEPVSPNRPLILFLGFVLSLGSGVGYALVSDAMSSVVRGTRNVRALVGVLPLSVIPYQRNSSEIARRYLMRKRFIISALVVAFILILLIHFMHSPLDVLWFRALRKVDTLSI